MKNKILLIGGYGYQDTGDESQLAASIASLRKYIPDVELVALSDNPEQTRKLHSVDSDFSIRRSFVDSIFHRRQFAPSNETITQNSTKGLLAAFFNIANNLKIIVVSLLLVFNVNRVKNNKKTLLLNSHQIQFLNHLKTSDLLFCVGGGNITSVWHSEFYLKCLTFMLCRMFELPVILSGQTIGPINGCFDSFFANYALNGVNVITLRENESIHTLKRLCVNKPVIQVTADDSVNLIPAALPVLDQIIVTEYSRIKRPIIGLNIFGLNLHGSEADFLNAKKLLAKVADYLIDKYDVTIVFVPMQYSDPDDRIAESETISLMANKKNVFVLTKVHSYSEIKGLVGRMDLVIGFRYHFITFAVTSGVPAIGLYSNSYYSRKICGILSLVGLPDNALNLRKIGYDDLILLVENQFANKASLRAMLVDQTVKLQAKSLLSVKYAVALLK